MIVSNHRPIMAAALLGALAACATAVEDSKSFRAADLNGDGRITEREWTTRADRLFDGLDKNGDGFITVEELQGGFDRIDQNHDGAIDGEESAALVRRADGDGDGRVTPNELEVYRWEISDADSDNDGRISRSEFRRAQARSFNDFDRDRDRMLRASEIDDRSKFTLFQF